MIYAASPALDDLRVRRARRGALPPGPLPRAGVGGGDRPPAARGDARVPLGDGVERRGGRRLDRDGPRAAPRPSSRSTGRSTLEHRYLVGERGADQLHLLPTFVAGPDGELRPNPDAARLDARNARDPRLARPAPHAGCAPRAGSRPSSCSRRSRCCPRSRSSSAARAATRRCEQCLAAGLRLTEPRRAGPDPRDRRRQDRRPRRRRPRRARLRPVAGRARGRLRRPPRRDGAADEGGGRGGASPPGW